MKANTKKKEKVNKSKYTIYAGASKSLPKQQNHRWFDRLKEVFF